MRFHTGELSVQQQAGVRTVADEVGEGIHGSFTAAAKAFLELQQLVILGTLDLKNYMWASVATGDRGFVKVVDEKTLRIAALPASGDPLLKNLAREGHVGLLAPDFVAPRRLRVNGRGLIKDGQIYIEANEIYGNCRRYIQERAFVGVRQAGPTRTGISRSSRLSAAQRQQISLADTFFIASDHPRRGADISHKGGSSGFVRVLDETRIAFPDYNGNSMFNTLGNITVNPHVGLLFIDFDNGRTLQLTGDASIDWSPKRVEAFAGAERVVDFKVAQILENQAGFNLESKFRAASRSNPQPSGAGQRAQ